MEAEGVPRRIRAFDSVGMALRLRQTEPFNHNNSRSKTGEYRQAPGVQRHLRFFLALGNTNTYAEVFKPVLSELQGVVEVPAVEYHAVLHLRKIVLPVVTELVVMTPDNPYRGNMSL